jgi:hypothetical protein
VVTLNLFRELLLNFVNNNNVSVLIMFDEVSSSHQNILGFMT